MTSVAKNIVFFIVTYKEHFDKSVTYNKLIESFFVSNLSNQISVFIFDNTPQDDVHHYNTINTSVDDKRINLKYFTKKSNIGLAKAYNFLANEAINNGYEWVVLLDQDTTLPKNFYDSYVNTSEEILIQAPKVLSNGKMISPALYSNYRSKIIKDVINCTYPIANISCINSGLLINLDLYKMVGGYNEELFLDFCDHEFMLRVKQKYTKIRILEVFLTQDFSNDVHDFKQAFFRYKLFLNDLVSFSKNKSKFKIFLYVDLPRVLSLSKKFKTFKFIKYRFFNN